MGLMRLRGLLLGLVGVLVLGLPGVALGAEGGCPNEALRVELGDGFLPDCRAFEMVSPVYKEGYEFGLDDVSSGGDRAFVFSLGAVAGIEGEGANESAPATYMGTRTASGWRLEPVMAPSSEFAVQDPLASDADSGVSLWEQRTPGQSVTTYDEYVRSASGVYSLVGPLQTPEEEQGKIPIQFTSPITATSDYSHVLLASTRRWPFDEKAPEGSLLYEYSGTGNSEPILVDVTGARGSTQVIGGCEALLGSGGSGSAYNALSAEGGETVFFTPVCEGEVWARRHGSLLSSLPAESVDVSARAPEPACSGACRSSAESGKEFEGASKDGERVFFTSTQQLLNGASQDPQPNDDAYNKNESHGCSVTTGAGGCNLYEYDFGASTGGNLRLVAGGGEVLGVARVADDGSRVYFVARGVLTGKGNEFGAMPVAGEPNLYVYDAQEAERDAGYRPVFIATLGSSDSADWYKVDDRPVQATPDGRFLVFTSSRPGLTPGDTATTEQLFEYDAQTGELVRVTQGEDGYNDNGNDAAAGVEPISRGIKREFIESRTERLSGLGGAMNESNVADDGGVVVFTDVGRLSPLAFSAEQGCGSVYEYRSDGAIADGGVHLISDGRDEQSSFETEGACLGGKFLGMDAEGENILFSTADPLVASDTDGVQRDVYDARVGGGFAAPTVPAACRGEGCLGAPAAPPGLASVGSVVSSGGGNVPLAVSPVVVKPGVRVLTRAQRLARALRSCRGEPRRRRGVCEARARKRYAVVSRAGRATGRGDR
jgi:WD40-like Beta Propeller Repeat